MSSLICFAILFIGLLQKIDSDLIMASKSESWSNLILDSKRNRLYAAGENTLKMFDFNLTIKNEVKTFENDYNKILLIGGSRDRLIACGTNETSCVIRDPDSLNILQNSTDKKVVNSNRSRATTAVIGKKNTDTLFVGNSFDENFISNSELTINKLGYNGIFAASIEGDRAFDFVEYSKSRATFPQYLTAMPLNIRVDPVTNTNKYPDITYVASFVVEEFVYFFKIRRYPSHEAVVARICEGDKNFFNSYYEMPLTCNNLTRITSVSTLPADSKLSSKINMSSSEVIFITSFYDPLSSNSVLCLFSLSQISREFTSNKRICPGDELFYIPKSQEKCLENVTEDFCGGERDSKRAATNAAVGTVFTVKPLTTVPLSITSMFSRSVEQASILLLGTGQGGIVKMDLSSPNLGFKFINQGDTTAAKDLVLTEDAQFVFWRTSNQIYRTELTDCEAFKSCDACVSPSNPVCGWCAMEGKCTRRSSCHFSVREKGWIPSYGSTSDCPSLMEGIEIETTINKTLTIGHSNLPDLSNGESYECIFNENLISTANTTSSRISCPIPASLLGDSYEGKFSLRFSGNKVLLFERTFFVYRCSSISTCNDCANKRLCRFDTSSYTCSTSSGGKVCPSLVDYSTKVHSNNDLILKFELMNVQDLRLEDMNCWIPSLNVTLKINRSDGYFCQAYKFTTSKASERVLVYVTFGSSRTLNGSIEVEVYNCNELGRDDCSFCKGRGQGQGYNCIWCGRECSFQKCSVGATETGCPYPDIKEIAPLVGPKEGGTLLTVSGTNLGSSADQILVKVDGKLCNSVPELYQLSRRFSCKVPSSPNASGPASVSLQVIDVGENTSVALFNYTDVEVFGISPLVGPEAGGTRVALVGNNLLVSPQTHVALNTSNDVGLQVIRNESGNSRIVFRTPPGIAGHSLNLMKLQIDGFVNKSLMQTFTYGSNPVIGDVTWAKFKSSICNLTLVGSNLNISSSSSLVYEDCKSGTKDTIEIFPSFNRIDAVLPNLDCSEVRISVHLDDWSKDLKVKVIEEPKFKIQNQENSFYKIAVEDNNSSYYFTQSGSSIFLVSKTYAHLSGQIELKNKENHCTKVSALESDIICELKGDPGEEVLVTLCSMTYKLPLKIPFPVLQTVLGVCAGVALVVLLVVCATLLIKYFESRAKYENLLLDINHMEQEARTQMKEAFAKLQTSEGGMSDETLEAEIPFNSFRDYAFRVLYPKERDNSVLHTKKRLDKYERKNQCLTQLLNSKFFFIIFVKVLEKQKDINEKSKIGSYLGLFLLDKMDYAAQVVTSLLSDRIDSFASSGKNLKLMMRSGDTVVERLMSCWLSLTMYKHLRGRAGRCLFELFTAIKRQVYSGPVDVCTNEAKFTLSEGFFLKNYKFDDNDSMVVTVLDSKDFPTTCKLLSCDAISQAREKVHEVVYRGVPYKDRIPVGKFDLVWRRGPNDFVKLLDEDGDIYSASKLVRIRTLGSYGVSSGAVLKMERRQGEGEESQAQILGEEILALSIGSPSLYPITVKMPQRRCHLVDKAETENGAARGKLFFTSMYYPLLQTKVALEEYIDKLFREVLNANDNLPPSVKYLFDFIDDSIRKRGISDPDVAKLWKRDSFILRVWVNLIQNPYFLLDVPRNAVVDVNLSVIGQALVDSCSTQEKKLTKDSPTSALLFAKNHKDYRPLVHDFYDTIQGQPRLPESQFMKIMESTYSKDINFNVDFNLETVLSELYEFARKFKEEILVALDEDEPSRNLRLVQKFQFLLNIE